MDLDQREISALDCLNEADDAVGSWALVELMKERNYQISSATAGRILHGLEKKGYVRKVSNSGRTITPRGRQVLAETTSREEMSEHDRQMKEVITTYTLENYLTVLQARRAVERETAHLAAIKISDEELQQLSDLLKQQDERWKAGKSIANIDVEFHRIIAHASGNKILEALYYTLFSHGQQTALFEQIRKNKRSATSAHFGILEALQAHDAKKAEQRMLRHLDSLIQDVITYWSTLNTEDQEPQPE